jgi:Flp pilus assembly protein TadB
MTLNDAFQGQSIKSTHLLLKVSLLVLGVTASLMLTYRYHDGVKLGTALALGTVVVPAIYVLARRMRDKVRHQEMEDRLMEHTRIYLRSPEAAREPESEIRMMARTIDGRKLPAQDFRKLDGVTPQLPVGVPLVFNTLPPRYAIRSLYDRRFADLAATLPSPACLPLTELLPARVTEEFGR